MTFFNIFVTTRVSLVREEIVSIHFDTYSITTRINLFPVEDGKGPIESILHEIVLKWNINYFVNLVPFHFCLSFILSFLVILIIKYMLK